MTMNSVYVSMYRGERLKINTVTNQIDWAVQYGDNGNAMALSLDETYLLAGSRFSSTIHLGKLSSSNGSVL